jgi:FkbM family methyltransferase
MISAASDDERPSALAQLPRASFHELAEKVKLLTPSPFVLQLGAMDGVFFDLLNPHLTKGGWRGILVEPLPDMFAKLQETYAAQKDLKLVNCAISDREGALTLRRIDPEAVASGLLPKGFLGMTTSFTDRGFPARSDYAERLAPHTTTIEVPCLPLEKLLAAHGVDKIDVAVIDTEGGDWQIAKQLDFPHYKPRLFCMEYSHLPPEEIAEACLHLSQRGYALALCHEDPENILFYRNLKNA